MKFRRDIIGKSKNYDEKKNIYKQTYAKRAGTV